jgi:hypothetical protein
MTGARFIFTSSLAAAALLTFGCSTNQGAGAVVSPTAPTPAPVQPMTGTLSGRIVKDLNGNGQLDPGEPYLVSAAVTCVNSEAVAGLTVSWTGTTAGTASVNQCDATGGLFRAENLTAGAYAVSVSVPPGWTAVKAASNLTLSAGGAIADTFFLQPPSQTPAPTPTVLRTTTFQSANGYTTAGTADIVRTGSAYTLELRDDFRTSNGGILDVRLCRETACTAADLNLGSIQSHNGRQTYSLPNDATAYRYVVIFCRAVNAPFGYGLLR